MKKRPALTFSLRIDATDPIEIVKEGVEQALDCSLQDDDFAGGPSLVGEVLGTQIALFVWRGIDGVYVYQLHGDPGPRDIGVEWDEIRIDRFIIALLARRGAGSWRQPSRQESLAEGDYDLKDINLDDI